MDEKELNLNAWYYQLAATLNPDKQWLRPEDGCDLLWSMFWGFSQVYWRCGGVANVTRFASRFS